MKKVLLAIAMVMLVVSPALAFDLGGYIGPVIFKYADFSEGTVYSYDGTDWDPGNIPNATYGQNNGTENAWGIAKITSIETPGAVQLWSELSSGEQLTVMYHSIDDDYVGGFGGGFDVRSIGGALVVYLQNTSDGGYTAFDATGGPGARGGLASYPTVTDGTLFLSANFVPGILYGDADTTNDHITYRSLFDPTQTLIPQALGNFYLEITGGAFGGMFNTDGFVLVDDSGVTHYADLKASFRGSTPGSYGWLVNSQDPVEGKVIPEPTSMVLLGIGLAGVARLRRRKS